MTLDDLRSLNMKDALVAANKLDLASRAQLLSILDRPSRVAPTWATPSRVMGDASRVAV
jgi:hypothetical protein